MFYFPGHLPVHALPHCADCRAAKKYFQPGVCLQRGRHIVFAHSHKYLHDHRIGAGDRYNITTHELWRFIFIDFHHAHFYIDKIGC